jgi:hypothetical protein
MIKVGGKLKKIIKIEKTLCGVVVLPDAGFYHPGPPLYHDFI